MRECTGILAIQCSKYIMRMYNRNTHPPTTPSKPTLRWRENAHGKGVGSAAALPRSPASLRLSEWWRGEALEPLLTGAFCRNLLAYVQVIHRYFWWIPRQQIADMWSPVFVYAYAHELLNWMPTLPRKDWLSPGSRCVHELQYCLAVWRTCDYTFQKVVPREMHEAKKGRPQNTWTKHTEKEEVP